MQLAIDPHNLRNLKRPITKPSAPPYPTTPHSQVRSYEFVNQRSMTIYKYSIKWKDY